MAAVQTVSPVLLAGAGGFLGSAARYLVGGWVHRLAPFSGFPLGTLAVNVVGCFVIGVLGGWIDGRQLFSPEARVFLLIGVLGGFTTFSSFAYETLALTRDAQFGRALVNVTAQVVLGLGAAWLGHALVRA
jgi:CrcB protein